MKWKSVAAAYLVIWGLLLASCALFDHSIPPIEFSIEGDSADVELTVLNTTGGAHKKREDGVIIADIPSGGSAITFMVRSGAQASQFVAGTYGSTGPMGAMSGVGYTYGSCGGMWLATRSASDHRHYIISGIGASAEAFVVGQHVRRDKKEVPLIERVAPHTVIQLGPQSPGVSVTGRGGASVQAYIEKPITHLEFCAPFGSRIVVEQGDGSQELKVDRTLLAQVVMRPGRARIRWFPTGSEVCHVEILIDAVAEGFGFGGGFTFSSMLDEPPEQKG